jgi:hypothetical protein
MLNVQYLLLSFWKLILESGKAGKWASAMHALAFEHERPFVSIILAHSMP